METSEPPLNPLLAAVVVAILAVYELTLLYWLGLVVKVSDHDLV